MDATTTSSVSASESPGAFVVAAAFTSRILRDVNGGGRRSPNLYARHLESAICTFIRDSVKTLLRVCERVLFSFCLRFACFSRRLRTFLLGIHFLQV